MLSPGEQQRIAFARILLTKPKAVFLDESTSALDEGLELMLYSLVRSELPDTILVSVSHRSTVEQHHTQELQLLGEGRWQLGAVGEEPAARRASPSAAPRALAAARLAARVLSRPPAEERPLAELRAAGVALAVLGDVGGARARGVQPADRAAVLAQHLAVDRHRQAAHREAGVHRPAQ